MNNSQQQNNGYQQESQSQQQNYQGDFQVQEQKRRALQARLYDSGISNIPMPSVKRPIEDRISAKPFSARMNSSKIQSVSNLKKKIQTLNTNIILNLNESYKEAAVQEAKYKGEGTADYYKQQQIVIPAPQYINTSTAGRKLQGSLGVPQAGQPRYASNLFNRKGQVEPLDPEYTSQVQEQLQNSGMQAGKLMAGPPSLVYAGFEGGESMSQKNLEQARCKFLLDKLTGKLPNRQMLAPIPEGSVNGDTVSQGSAAKSVSKSQMGEDEEEVKAAEKKKPQQWSELDKFIELLLDSKSDEETVFLYLNPNESGDPYDLQVTTYINVKEKHFTLSSKGITEYESKVPREFLSLGQWLIERDSYNHIKTYRFFSQFNKWKFMRMWKKTIKHQNRVKAQNQLEEKLFILQDTFRSHLMQHRNLMLSMSQVCFIDVCRTGDTKNIDEFTTAQMNMIKKARKQIMDASANSRENIQKCIERVLHELRNQIMDDMSMDEDRKKQSPVGGGNTMSMKRKEANSVFDKLGFPSGMTYGHRSSLRKECLRFLRFAYLADFLSLDALSKIYTGSVAKMIERLENLNDSIDMEKIMGTEFDDDGGSGMQAQRGQEPLFYVNVTIEDSKEIEAKEIIPVEIDEFILPPRGTSVMQDFDLLTHIQLEPEKDPNEEEEDDGEEKETEKVQLFKQTVPNIHKFWIQLVPEKKDFIDRVLQTFTTGLEQIQCFTRWSKHKDLQDYADALEDWDDMQGEWEEPESIFLNPQGWIMDKEIQKTKDFRVKSIVDSAFDKSQMFIQRFQGLLEIYWRNKQFDLDILVDERLRNSVDTLKYTIDLFKYYRDYFRDNLPQQTDIGLLQIDSRVIKQMLAPTPERYIKQIEELLPRVQKERTQLARAWIENSTRALKKPVNSVEDFVEQVNALQKINQFYQDFRDKVDLYQANYTVLDQSDLRVDKIDKENFKATDNEAKSLQLLIQAVESDAPTQNERFKKDLQKLIPDLKDEIELLHNQSKNPVYLDCPAATDPSYASNKAEMIKQLEAKVNTFKELEQRAEKYNDWQIRLETPLTQFDDLDELREDLMNRYLMWTSLRDWEVYQDIQRATNFGELDAPTVKIEAEKYAKIVSRLEKTLVDNVIQKNLKEMVETFRGAMPIVTALRRPQLKKQHWDEINELIGAPLEVEEEGFTLQSLIDMNVVPFQEEIEVIATRAVGEDKLVSLRAKLTETWKGTELDMAIYKERDGVFILNELPTLYDQIDEALADINTILGNRFVGFMRKDCESLKKDIQNANNIVGAWVTLQKDWIYLENIFTSAELRKSLQRDANDFDQVDKFFKSMCVKAAKMPSISRFVKQPQISYENIMAQNLLLEKVTAALNNYMESKRDAFPRFYFLSDDEVLEILAKSDDTSIVQQYLKTMFDGVVKVTIVDNIEVTHMKSKEGEAVPLATKVKIKKEVDVWLGELQAMIIQTLRKEMKKAVSDYGSQNRKDWVMDPKHPGQCVATVAQIMWCQTTESHIADMADENPFALQEWWDAQVLQIEELTVLVRGNLSDLQRCVVVALITTDVHARDIVEDLKTANVTNNFDFEWQKQLRYYWLDEPLDCKVQQIQATLMYGYEYMGATSRLVITPLTDKCWITITGALHIKLGANPAGPAGTGKTESTKDLAKAIAIYCVVYNCSDQVVYKIIKQHFKGLAQQGCWTCLDEFNRIDIEVLSVIAQLLQTIRNELIKVPLPERFFFEDADIRLLPDFGCHVTMNPGYAGRQELPDNLKVLFRPVAMMVPSYQLIAEIMLGAEGFSESKILSRKMKNLYKLSSEQLSQQSHYDFGMRAVKSVLVQAGTLKRKYQELPEDSILIRAMCDANVPKFLKDDIPLFYAIVQDLFPSSVLSETDNSEIFKQFTKSCIKFNWQPHVPFMKKIVQLLETFGVRFGVMLVGYTGGGKTASYTILKDTMCALREAGHPDRQFQKVNSQLLNPKSITMDELFGAVDKDTNEWRDGLASKMLRNSANIENDDLDWTIFDGPVDALWIENMNTVLDDNMTLCLANGQRLKLRPQMRMLFEVQDLLVASPATVSRCGMVYMTPEDLGWRPYVKSWITSTFGLPGDESAGIDDQTKLYIEDTFEATIDIGLDKIRNNYKEPIVTDNLQLVKSVCNLLYVFLAKGAGKGFSSLDPKQRKKDLDALFAWSYAWGMGGSLNEASKDFFDSVVKDLFKGVSFPPAFTVFDYFYDLKREKVFKPWDSKVEGFTFDKEKAYFELFVNTSDTYKHKHVLELLLGIEKPCFFTGTTGVGKTVVILNTLERLAEQNVVSININFSAQTTSLQTQQSIEDKLEKSRVSFFPPPGKKVAIFVDDINMPKVEFYGAQPPIELLRLLVDRKGVFDRAEWEWKEVTGCTLIACAAPPEGGRAVISPRLSTHFNVLCMPTANASVLDKIFKSILEGFLKTGFAEPIQATAGACINSTIEIYNRIAEELRPTPAKFHYIFNLRDISKVVQGILMSFPVSIQTTDQMAKLWLNETARVFHDRLIDDTDREWFIELAMDLMSREFRSSIDRDEVFGSGRVLVGDILKLDAPKKLYEVIGDPKKLHKCLMGWLDDFNMSTSNKMNLVFFDDAIGHIMRIARVLRQARGSLMLIGMGGSGKQSLIRMSSFMYEMQYRTVEIKKGFNQKMFREDIKEMMFESGIHGRKIAFTMTDNQIVSESFLEDLNNMLNTGEIPNLMAPEDKEMILGEEMRKVVLDKKLIDTNEQMQAMFVDRVREYFHICLCMSPVGDALRIRARNFPSLVNCCTLDWFSSWPQEALIYVSTEYLKEMELPSEDVRVSLANMCAAVHVSVKDESEVFWGELRRRIYTTPKSYLDLISLYINKLDEKRKEYNANRDRLAIGLKKLSDTKIDIEEFKQQLKEAAPQMKEMSEKLAVSVEIVVGRQKIADENKKTVGAEAEIVGKKASEAEAIEHEVQGEVDACEPEVKAAQAALNSIAAADLVELKGLNTPKPGIVAVMQVVFILLGDKNDVKKPPEWKKMQVGIKNPSTFLKGLVDFKVTEAPEAQFKKVKKDYMSKAEFNKEHLTNLSKCAGALFGWVTATVKYQELMKNVTPKLNQLKSVKKIAGDAKAELKQKTDALEAVLAEVQALNDDLNAKKAQLQGLEQNITRCTAQLGRAETVVVLLADEGIRWKETVEKIQIEIDNLVGNVFLSCACISYYGAFTGLYRKKLTDGWTAEAKERNIPTSDIFNLANVMGDGVTIRGWQINGLPSDNTSTENGILTTLAERWGLCIDPQQQANKWIKNMMKDDDMQILNFAKTNNFQREISGAIRNGKPVLIEDIEEYINPAIEPVLLKQQYLADGGLLQIKLGDAIQDYDENFKLFMTTKLSNPHYPPEVCIKVTLINFTVTMTGLEEQLLNDVVLKEKPATMKQKDTIVVQMDKDNKTLKRQENEILQKLAKSTKEQILDEDTLIDMLKSSKKVSDEIATRIEEAVVIEQEIAETMAGYTSVAVRGSIIYFVVADLANVNDMYQNSLQYVKVLFGKAIDNTKPCEELKGRLELLEDTITKLIYTNIARGLFEKDKLLYSFLVATSIRRNMGIISMISWNHLLRGPMPFSAAQLDNRPPNPLPLLMNKLQYDTFYSMQCNEGELFEGIIDSVKENLEAWTEWISCENPHTTSLPCGYHDSLAPFHKLLMLRVFRPEKLLYAFQLYVKNQMGDFFVASIDTSMANIYKDTSVLTPLVYVLSTGADPLQALLNFAATLNMSEKLRRISLGQGQGPKAIIMVEEAMKVGNWVMLQNCHLAASFMQDLEMLVSNLAEAETIHENFRLYLTSAPTDIFPVSVLQVSVKLTTEPPRGLKANLKRTYAGVDDELLESCPQKPEIWCKLFFSLAFFHSVMQERRKFGPLGFNVVYEFNDSDLETSQTMLKNFLESQVDIPWIAMNYVISCINYGGRVTDDWDLRCLQAQLKICYQEEALNDGYTYSESGKYYAPSFGKIGVYKDYIEQLPLVDSPEVFGLHANANISYQRNESDYCVDTVLNIQPRIGGGGGGPTPDEIVLAKQIQLLTDLPDLLDKATGKKELFKEKNGLLTSLTTVLLLEMEKFNRLLGVMKRSLTDLDLAIHGFIVMSETLDKMYVSLQNGKVPDNWTAVGYNSLKPLAPWYTDLLERVAMFRLWLEDGQPNAYWLSGFFFPQGFMTGCLQTHARQHKIAIDRLTFGFQIMAEEKLEDFEEPPEEGMYIYGLFLDGARWNRDEMCIDDQHAAVLYDPMPVVQFIPKVDLKDDEEQYYAPLYKTAERKGVLSTTGMSTNFIVPIACPTKADPSLWVRRAAAMLCQLSD